jgi:hypothetical protein
VNGVTESFRKRGHSSWSHVRHANDPWFQPLWSRCDTPLSFSGGSGCVERLCFATTITWAA